MVNLWVNAVFYFNVLESAEVTKAEVDKGFEEGKARANKNPNSKQNNNKRKVPYIFPHLTISFFSFKKTEIARGIKF